LRLVKQLEPSDEDVFVVQERVDKEANQADVDFECPADRHVVDAPSDRGPIDQFPVAFLLRRIDREWRRDL
jgi:hypothetical protein